MKLLFSVAIQHAVSSITWVSKFGGHSIMGFGEISWLAAISIFTLFFHLIHYITWSHGLYRLGRALPLYLCIPRQGRIGYEVFYDVMKLLTPKLAGTFIVTHLSLTLSSYFPFLRLLYCLPCTFPFTHLMQSYNCTFLKAIIITTTSPSLVSHELHCNGSTINTTFSMMYSH